MMVSSFENNNFTLLFSTLFMGCEYHDVNIVKLRLRGWFGHSWLALGMESQCSASAYVWLKHC
jgi:hypothetical protein